jgi:glutathione S-transferase
MSSAARSAQATEEHPMITLHGSGPHWGLPDASPFVTKAEVLLKMAGLPYRHAQMSFAKAPKGKIPYIDDDGTRLGDSTFIRWHLETRHGIDFDRGLSPAEKSIAWAFEKMAEEVLYWAIVDHRWHDPVNFDRGPRTFFKAAPAPIRPLVIAMVRRAVKRNMHGHGMGRHSRPEIEALGVRCLEAIAAHLADKPWLMGAEPCGADASVWAMVTGAMCPHFEGGLRRAGERHPNLVAYRDRGMGRWFPETAVAAARGAVVASRQT